jgi:chaperonin GroEL (HSP60 family)
LQSRKTLKSETGPPTVVILAGEFLRECKPFVEDGVHPQNIIKHFREAAQMAIARVKSLSGEFFLFLFANGVLYFRTGN